MFNNFFFLKTVPFMR